MTVEAKVDMATQMVTCHTMRNWEAELKGTMTTVLQRLGSLMFEGYELTE
jgi:hypothetical protein